MRVIITNQVPSAPMTNVSQPPPHYAVGRLDGYGGDRIIVAGLPEAGAAFVAFSRETGEFMSGPNLNYLDFVLLNREAIEENIGPQPKVADAMPTHPQYEEIQKALAQAPYTNGKPALGLRDLTGGQALGL